MKAKHLARILAAVDPDVEVFVNLEDNSVTLDLAKAIVGNGGLPADGEEYELVIDKVELIEDYSDNAPGIYFKVSLNGYSDGVIKGIDAFEKQYGIS